MKIYKLQGPGSSPSAGLSERDLYVGIDVHKVSWDVSVVQDGRVIKNVKIPGSWSVLQKFLERYVGLTIHAVYEAGYFGYDLHDQLVQVGIECTVVAPSLIPRAYGNRVKTDRLDSTKLALMLYQGILKPISVPSGEQRSHRAVLRRYHQLVGDRVRAQLRMKAELRFFNLPFPEIRGTWSKQFVENLHRIIFKDRWLQESFHRLLLEYEHVQGLIDAQMRLIKELAGTDLYRERVRLLRTVPGIGLLTAMEFLVELGDVKRFPTSRQLAAYVGLTPAQYSSGEHTRMGRITRTGKAHLRGMLIESAWILVRKDPQIHAKYEQIKVRSGAKRAIVAIARRLLIRARRVVVDGMPYRLGSAA